MNAEHYNTSSLVFLGILLVALAVTRPALGGDLIIDSGATVKLNENDLLLDGSVTNNGTLSATTANIILTGNWSNPGSFEPGTSNVQFDGGDHVVSGDTDFYNFTKIATVGNSIMTFEANKQQRMHGKATLRGVTGEPMSLLSSASPTQWKIAYRGASGTVEANYVRVGDSTAETAIRPYNSRNAGGDYNWLWGGPWFTLKAYMQGFYNPATLTHRPTTIEVQLRDGATAATATTVLDTKVTTITATGTADVDFHLSQNVSFGNYYIAVLHKVTDEAHQANASANHLAVITATNPYMDDSNPSYVMSLTADASSVLNTYGQALVYDTNAYTLRGGDANADGKVSIGDDLIYKQWAGRNVPPGSINVDYNGDLKVSIGDNLIYKQNAAQRTSTP